MAGEPTDGGGRPELTRLVTRGVVRLFVDLDWAPVTELRLANNRRVDLMAVDRAGTVVIVEVKSDAADYRADRKWRDYLDFCDRFYFAVHPDFPHELLPEDEACGLILADRYEAAVLREPAARKLPAARRKAVLLKFARTAGQRLYAATEILPETG